MTHVRQFIVSFLLFMDSKCKPPSNFSEKLKFLRSIEFFLRSVLHVTHFGEHRMSIVEDTRGKGLQKEQEIDHAEGYK